MRRLAQITPIVRGLLAESTGNDDMPFKPVVLKFSADKDSIGGLQSSLKSEKPPLFLDAPDEGADPEKLREQFSDAISNYSAQHNAKPEIICVRDFGVLYVEPCVGTSGLPLGNKVALIFYLPQKR